MKLQLIRSLLLVMLAGALKAQNTGRLIIRNADPSYPGIIVSLNGVRLINEYKPLVCFDFLDDNNYRVRILQAGSARVLNFAVNCSQNYVCKYLLTKDNTGNYNLILESKSLMGSESQPEPAPEVTPVATGPVQMGDKEYQDVLKAIKKESFETNRLEMAKTFFDNQYLSSWQVTGVLKAFTMESSRLNFAKFAYSRTLDKNSYYKTFDAFSLSSSKREMSEYIKNNP